MGKLRVLVFFCLVSIGHTIEDTTIEWQKYKPKICVNDENFSYANRSPVRIFLSVAILGIYDIRDDQMELTTQLGLTEVWSDPNLGLENVSISESQTIPNYFSNCIWTPDIFIRNEKMASIYGVTSINRVFKILPGGYIFRYSRYRVTLDCPMSFRMYPMDVQTCSLIMSLLSSLNNEARLSWMGNDGTPTYVKNESAVYLANNVRPLQFTMGPLPKLNSYNISFNMGNKTILECTLEFHRHITAALVNTYIPSFLVVCLSFVSFWIDVTAIPGRVTLGVTALLTLATQIVHARHGLPDVEYLTAMDVWLFGCLVAVFSCLIEFTLAHSSHQREVRMTEKAKSTTYRVDRVVAPEDTINDSSSPKRKIKLAFDLKTPTKEDTKSRHFQNKFDHVSQFLFPISAFTFVLIYWGYYLWCAVSPTTPEKYALITIHANKNNS